jgi:SAM-dependent methyltransferase
MTSAILRSSQEGTAALDGPAPEVQPSAATLSARPPTPGLQNQRNCPRHWGSTPEAHPFRSALAVTGRGRRHDGGTILKRTRQPRLSHPPRSRIIKAVATTVPFWKDAQPGFRFTRHEPGTPAFFRDVERHRYTLEPHIPEFARFDAWRGADVLEVGCGLATDASRFARGGARYTGIDVTDRAIELARRRFALEGLDGAFLRADATRLPFPNESFDLVYSYGVLHHISDTEAAVQEIHRVLRIDGTALVMVYHRGSLNYRFNILVVRRLLAATLVVPAAEAILRRIAPADPEMVTGHKELLRIHGLRYFTDTALFLSNNTDGPGNPLSKVYSRREARHLFRSFSDIDVQTRYLNLRLYPKGDRLAATRLARRLERSIGWHLCIHAKR